jgi:hypothetical protein
MKEFDVARVSINVLQQGIASQCLCFSGCANRSSKNRLVEGISEGSATHQPVMLRSCQLRFGSLGHSETEQH